MKEDFYGRSCFLVKLVLIHINHIVIVQDFLLVDLGLDDVFDPAFCAARVVGGDKIGNAAVDKADTEENVCGCNGIKRIGTDDDAENAG